MRTITRAALIALLAAILAATAGCDRLLDIIGDEGEPERLDCIPYPVQSVRDPARSS